MRRSVFLFCSDKIRRRNGYFQSIGDIFGGLFGQKKKREDEQPQPQQQQSAVSFNSTPKLGDNFANNSSNPAQPQQPKEFAKSSVDLNPVKPVQPVQPQPQVNRDQERQQLANKYRQEETDRYNQGSDHAANFLNDIFSGGKTAQMRENTINQNIQNRVNAEMLRKYGPDDQQVKQNIAQTSQDINNKATSVNDFTKNYNNTVQQTVASPVSAVKGAANSVVETMPKVSGAVTELGANTIKLFDEDNQFANNLIDRVRADREKNIVRKTLNSATGLTDQDNKMAYGLGSSGTRMAIDAAMTPVTGGVAPALVHGVEAHSDMMDSLDNIEARKKAEAAAKGEAYTPSSFGSRYLASTANAGAQAAIEKLGIDNVTGKIGGKFAKNMVGRAVTGALGEAGEEAAQQYAENFTKKLFDNKQNIHEGVAESALMGGIMGGVGKMAFGGMDGRRVNVTESYVKKGGILIGKSKIRVNDYADIDTAGAHPNCSCVEKFGIEEEKDKIFDYSKLNQDDPEYMYPHEQDFYERLVKNFNNVERVPKHKTEPSNDFTVNGESWELKSILGKVKPMTIRNEIYHATDKGKRNIFLDVYNQDIDVNDVIEKAKKHISIKKNNDKIDSLIVVSGDKFHKIK